jgi:hypothetical protein
MRKADLVAHLNALAPQADRWRAKNRYYYESLEKILRFHVPTGSSVLVIGSGT